MVWPETVLGIALLVYRLGWIQYWGCGKHKWFCHLVKTKKILRFIKCVTVHFGRSNDFVISDTIIKEMTIFIYLLFLEFICHLQNCYFWDKARINYGKCEIFHIHHMSPRLYYSMLYAYQNIIVIIIVSAFIDQLKLNTQLFLKRFFFNHLSVSKIRRAPYCVICTHSASIAYRMLCALHAHTFFLSCYVALTRLECECARWHRRWPYSLRYSVGPVIHACFFPATPSIYFIYTHP